MNNIHESLLPLAIDLNLLLPLENNPRVGNVQAIIASYEEFGQIKPIVVRPNGEGMFIVIAGNHQFQAAKKLGWDKIAAVQYDVDDQRAIAFAIADNRTVELGYTEPEILNEMILEINDYYPELLDGLGWDEFELAELEQNQIREDNQIIQSGSYVPPVMISQPENDSDVSDDENIDEYEDNDDHAENPLESSLVSVSKKNDGQNEISLKSSTNHDDVAVRGSTVALRGSAPSATVTVQITFDTTEQQAFWYEFIKTLKTNSDYPGATVSEKLINFIKTHS